MCWKPSLLSPSLTDLKACNVKSIKRRKKWLHFRTLHSKTEVVPSWFSFWGVIGKKVLSSVSAGLLLPHFCLKRSLRPYKDKTRSVCLASKSLTLNVTCCTDRTIWTRAVWFIRATQCMKDGRHPAISHALCYYLLQRFIVPKAGTLIAHHPKAAFCVIPSNTHLLIPSFSPIPTIIYFALDLLWHFSWRQRVWAPLLL